MFQDVDKWVYWPLWTFCPCTHQDNEHNASVFLLFFFFLFFTVERAHSTGFEVKLRSPLRGLFKCPADFSSVILSSYSVVVLHLSQGSEKEKQKSRKSVSFFFFFFKFTVTDRHVFFLSFVAWTGQQVVIADKSSALGEGADGGTSTALSEWRQPQRKAKSCQWNGKG